MRNLALWPKDSKESLFVRKLGHKSHVTDESYKPFAETRSATVVADIALCLINQVNFLLDQRIRQLEQVFLQEGGLHERMTRARLQSRNQNH